MRRAIERVTIAGHRLPAAEAEILRVLLACGRPLSVSEVGERLEGRRRAHTTVVTLLGRLLKRGLVTRTRDARGYRYFPIGSEQDLAVMALTQLLESIDDPAHALVAFISRLPARTRRSAAKALGGTAEGNR